MEIQTTINLEIAFMKYYVPDKYFAEGKPAYLNVHLNVFREIETQTFFSKSKCF